MKSKRPLISVIVPHLNQPYGLENCLASLDFQTLERSEFEVIVVDNGSKSPPEAVVKRHPGTVLLEELKPGPGLARNRGIEAASAEILAFIDADCRAHPDWLRRALRAVRTSSERTILGGDVQIWRESKTAFTALEAYECVFAYRFKLYIERHGFTGTGNLVVRRADFDKIGPFRGIEVAEDIDWGQRARDAGYRFCYVPEMIVFHPARQSLRELFVKWDRHIQHAVNTGEKSATWRVRWLLRAFAILISPVIDWTKVIASDRIHGVFPRIKAILVLVAVRAHRAYKMVSLLLSNKEVAWNRESAIAETDVHNDVA
jgi:cellulose synthase/poly-beta-1,6-N-acetylglucosamine synthase-like glycosyltransferase